MTIRSFFAVVAESTARRCFLFSLFCSGLLSVFPALAQPPAFAPGLNRFPTVALPAPATGDAAVRALGSTLPAIAAHYGLSPAEFARMLRDDPSAWIDRNGRAFFIDYTNEAEPLDASDPLDPAVYPLGETVLLNSKPGAPRTLFLDFDGHVTSGTAWNQSYGDPIVSPAYDSNGDPTTFSDGELRDIQRMWRLVAEDFAPFDVNVTTQDPGIDAIARSGSNDPFFGTRVVVTRDTFASCGCGGFAYLRAFDDTNDFLKPAFVFNRGVKGAGEAITHEAGHNLGLNHDGLTDGTAYYRGHGSGETGWAPIMGVGYYQNLVQWSAGEYSGANNLEDDLSRIQTYGAPLSADDHGNTRSAASDLAAVSDTSGTRLSGQGIVGTGGDTDVFRFFAGAGAFAIDVAPAPEAPNLDLAVMLADASGAVIASSNPPDRLAASLTGTLAAGEYFLFVGGSGKGDVLGTGYSGYASMGRYGITGSVADASGLQPPVAAAVANFTPGPSPLTVDFSAGSSSGADRFDWDFGDGGSGSGLSTSNTYMTPGNYLVTLTATDTGSGLSSTDTVSVTVTNRPPVAAIDLAPGPYEAPVAIEFDGRGSRDDDTLYDPAHVIASYQWDFGDGSVASGPVATHAYAVGGSFTTTLTVTDSLGATAIAARTLEIAAPPLVDLYASSEATLQGTAFGTRALTEAVDGAAQRLSESESGGRPARRTSQLEHRWFFDLPAGDASTLYLTAWQSSSTDGDTMQFSYQLGNGSEVDLPVQLGPSSATYPVLLPSTGGTLAIIVRDSDRTAGNRALDSVFVDALRIQVASGDGVVAPPSAPSGLTVTGTDAGSVSLAWTDNASDETGFRLRRSDNGGGSWETAATLGRDTTATTDTGLLPDTTYHYVIESFNSGGSAASSQVSARTDAVSALALSASGRKAKGEKIVALSWSGASDVIVYRDGASIASVSGASGYEDRDLGKGGGTYLYQVCVADLSVCSNPATVVF